MAPDSTSATKPAETTVKIVCGESALLQALLTQEEQQLDRWYRRKQCMTSQELDTKYGQRKECGQQIQAMCRYFEFSSPAVFAYSVAVMDCALVRVNIPWKYLSCFSAACVVIGNKWVEDESHPTLQELAELHYRQWKEVDLRRMEERVLKLLDWAVPRTTYLCFLTHILQALTDGQLSTSSSSSATSTTPPSHLPLPLSRSSLASQAVRNAELLLLNEFSFVLKPAAMALGAVEQALQQWGEITPDLAFSIVSLQDRIKVLDSELHEVGEVLSSADCCVQGEKRFHVNQAYFPKVFETPCDSFLPDHRLHSIPEECGSNSSSSVPTPRNHHSDVDIDSSPNSSISDYDYSEEEDERTERFCADGEDEEVETSDSTTGSLTGDEAARSQPPGVSAEEDGETTGISSDGVSHELARRAALTFEGRTRDEDSDSGCEQESDDEEEEEDGVGPCEEKAALCGGVSSSDPDSSDPDSDFHDCSPCSVAHVKACLSDSHASVALTFA